ncbi:hypothetical protein HYS93_01870 [Candidatus Daviesbacteria bacterium]|nr:hypothetical protein [Candidatus Daviesbacteria bacterium]
MRKLTLLWYFLAGLFAVNGVPHLVKGITGQTHMTPFARVSSPVLNVVWAFINYVVALYLLGLASGKGGLTLPWEADLVGTNFWAFLAGGVVIAVYLANFWSNPKAKLPWQ